MKDVIECDTGTKLTGNAMSTANAEQKRYELEETEKAFYLPDMSDCSDQTMPPLTEKSILKEADLVSMWEYMLSPRYANKRLSLYSFLNDYLRKGWLSDIVGFKVLNKVIDRKACELEDVTFWMIDRENFYADVNIKLNLRSSSGPMEWKGILVCWCCFDDVFRMSVEELVSSVDRKEEGLIMLSPFLIPYMKNEQMDAYTEQLWIENGMPGAIAVPSLRDAKKFAEKIGLSILPLDVFEHKNVDSIVFFEGSDLLVGEDRVEKQPDGTLIISKAKKPVKRRIPANTIVINTNRIRSDYASFYIFHECIHYLLHYLFYRLQKLGSSDPRQIRMKEKKEERKKVCGDLLFFMEQQGDRGGYGLMMPASDTRHRILEELSKAEGYKNSGGKFQIVGKALARQLGIPYFRIRARMIGLGYIEAKGALNYIDRAMITPFAFDTSAWIDRETTYVVRKHDVNKLRHNNADFNALMNSGKYIYADGHVVRNDPRFVKWQYDRLVLTDEAARRVDKCCLRFVRQYMQRNPGQYILGCMFSDPHYVEVSLRYLEQIMEEKNMDDIDARMEYEETFPRTFIKAFDKIMEFNGETRETVAARLHISTDKLAGILNDPEHKVTLEDIVKLTLMWELPDWIGDLLKDRAMVHFNRYDRRHRALETIRREHWDEGIEKANEYLTNRELKAIVPYGPPEPEGRKRKTKAS